MGILDMSNEEFNRWILSKAKLILTIVAVVLLITVFNPFVTVGSGERGIIKTWGAVSDNVLGEGLHTITPISQSVQIIDIRTTKHEVKAQAYSKDLQTVDMTIALNYHPKAETVNKLFQEIGMDYETRIIDPAIQEAAKATVAQFTAQELVEQRAKVKDETKNQLTQRLNNKFLVIDDFSIVNFDFSDIYEKAIEQKQVAQQDALKAENKLKQVQFEAEQIVATAKANAEAIRISSEAITQQGGKDYVQLQAIQKWDGKLPSSMIPNAVVPFIDLNK